MAMLATQKKQTAVTTTPVSKTVPKGVIMLHKTYKLFCYAYTGFYILYLLTLGFFLSHHPFQSSVIYLNWINWPSRVHLSTPAFYGVAGRSRSFTVHSTIEKKTLSLGAWHIIGPKNTLQSDPEDWDKELAQAPTVLLYLHGNGGNRALSSRVSSYNHFSNVLEEAHIIAIDYRGFGDSEGSPTEDGLIDDAEAIYTWMIKKGVDPSRIIVVAQSLGTGVAAGLLARLDPSLKPAGVVMLASFTSIPEAALTYPLMLPISPLLLAKNIAAFIKREIVVNFDTNHILKTQKTPPMLFLHGTHDVEIPSDHSQKNFETALTFRLGNEALTYTVDKSQEGAVVYYHDEHRDLVYAQIKKAGHNNIPAWASALEITKRFVRRSIKK